MHLHPLAVLVAPWLMPASEQQSCGVVIGKDYSAPVVDHALARSKTLALFKDASS